MASFKVCVITGASSGIGAATAAHFAKLGYKLSICGRNQSGLAETCERCLNTNANLLKTDILRFVGDVSDENHLENVVEDTIKHFGKIDVVIPNAGFADAGSIDSLNLEVYDNVMNVNCRSVLKLIQLCTPHLTKTKGNIVSVSSIFGPRPSPTSPAYSISKGALDQLTRVAALELAPKGVRVNSVNPGTIPTMIQKRAGVKEEQYEAFLEKTKTLHPLGRNGTVDDVAKAIAFLASEDASFITGVTLLLDGGRSLVTPR